MTTPEVISPLASAPPIKKMETKHFPKLASEFLGTMVLVLMGCGSAVIAGANGTSGVGLLGISFAFGLSVLAMVYAIGYISGCHINLLSLSVWSLLGV